MKLGFASAIVRSISSLVEIPSVVNDPISKAFENLMSTISTETITSETASDKAMKFFYKDREFADFMQLREQRNKIISYLSDVSAASTFLRVEDQYKRDFIVDFILIP